MIKNHFENCRVKWSALIYRGTSPPLAIAGAPVAAREWLAIVTIIHNYTFIGLQCPPELDLDSVVTTECNYWRHW